MPDRYGEPVDLDTDDARPFTAAERAALAVQRCDLCDTHGYRNGHHCDHIDRTDTYRRGIQACREALQKGDTA